MSQTILVTGATGYVGSWVVKYLLEKGYQVRITVRDKSRVDKYAFLQKIADESQGNIEVYEADLLTPGAYDSAAKGSDAIIHVASPFTLRFKNAIKEIIEPAIHGTENVLAAASSSKTVKKVVLTSSVVAVHGDNIDMQEKGLSELIAYMNLACQDNANALIDTEREVKISWVNEKEILKSVRMPSVIFTRH